MTTATGTLTLTTAIGGHSVYAALKDGTVKVDGVSFDFQEVTPLTAAFRKMCRTLDYDVCEMSLASYFNAREFNKPFTAIPAIPWQHAQHQNAVYNEASGIRNPKDLEGKKVGVRAWTVTPGIWVRGILGLDYGVDHTKVDWVLSDEEHVAECNDLIPANVTRQKGSNIQEMLVSGDLDAGLWAKGNNPEHIKGLIDSPDAACTAFWQRYGVFPLDHLIVIKNSVIDANPGLPAALYEAFKQSKAIALEKDPHGHIGGQGLKDGDPLPYGLTENEKSLNMFLDFCADQKVTQRRMTIEELFPLGLD
jgi:4,5-dihydroxyphthalate decarboxylase